MFECYQKINPGEAEISLKGVEEAAGAPPVLTV